MKEKLAIKRINAILNAWDPIGFTPGDEYQNLALEIFKRMEIGHNKEQLVKFIDRYLKKHIGLESVNLDDIESNVLAIIIECSYIENN